MSRLGSFGWPVLSRAERDRAHGRLDPVVVRKGFEEQLQLTPISEHGFQAQLLMRRILDHKGGVELVCELFQPGVLPTPPAGGPFR